MNGPQIEASPAAVLAAGLEADWEEVRDLMSRMSPSDRSWVEFVVNHLDQIIANREYGA